MKYTPRDCLIAIAIECDGDWQKIRDAIKTHKEPSEESYGKAINAAPAVTILDAAYPETLKNAPRPPFVLFGEIPAGFKAAACLQRKTQWFNDDEKAAYDCVRETLVDSEAAFVELNEHGQIIWQKGEECGVIQEFPAGHQETSADFVAGKRIAAWLAKDLFVFHVTPHGSTLIDVSLHLEKGDGTIYACPHPFVSDDQCNDLIASGCMPITEATLESWMPDPALEAFESAKA